MYEASIKDNDQQDLKDTENNNIVQKNTSSSFNKNKKKIICVLFIMFIIIILLLIILNIFFGKDLTIILVLYITVMEVKLPFIKIFQYQTIQKYG